VEVASIDEAYLDITQSTLLFKSPLHLAQTIKAHILEKEKLTCSVGIAPNKLLAKLASRLKKPDGLVVIEKKRLKSSERPSGIEALRNWSKLEEALQAMGIFACGPMGKFPVPLLIQRFGSSERDFTRWVLG